MTCQIFRNPKSNEVMNILASNGEDSILFKDAMAILNSSKEASLVWAHTQTGAFTSLENKKQTFLQDANNEPSIQNVNGVPSFINIDLVNRTMIAYPIKVDDKYGINTPEKDHSLMRNIEGVLPYLTPEQYNTYEEFKEREVVVSAAAEYHGEKLHKNLEKDPVTGRYGDNKQIFSVTGTFLTAMQGLEENSTEKEYAKLAADRIWKTMPPETLIKVNDVALGPITKDKFIEYMTEAMKMGTIKGSIFHKLFELHLTNDLLKKTKIQQEIDALMDEGGITRGELEWVNGGMVNKVLSRTGTDFVVVKYSNGDVKYVRNPNSIDKILAEVTLYSPILNMAGTVDLVVDHGDHIYSFYDLKTGSKFNRMWDNVLFLHGNGPTEDIWVNPRNKAKLQLMMYAVMAKIENPQAKFRALELIHVSNYRTVNNIDMKSRVNVGNYLKMIENYYKTEKPKIYAELKEKLTPEHFDAIFNPATYNVITPRSVNLLDGSSQPAVELHRKMLRLQELVLWDKNIEAGAIKGYKRSREVYAEILSLTKEIRDMRGNPDIDYAAWTTDMSWMDQFFGSASASTNPHVQLYYTVVQEAKQEASTNYNKWRDKFEAYVRALAREQGISDFKFGAGSLIGGVDNRKLLGWIVKEEKIGDMVSHRFMTTKDAEYANLSETKKNFVKFVSTSIGQFFVDDLSTWANPITNKKQAVANRVAKEEQHGDKVVKITNLELARDTGKLAADSFSKNNGKYFDGWMPKLPPLFEDIQGRYGIKSMSFLKFIQNRYLTNYFEAFYDGWYATDEAIPMKYLGGGEIDAGNNYTLNVETILDGFVKQYMYKQHMDQAYGFATGLKMVLHADGQKEGSVNYARTVEWFDKAIQQQILGVKDTEFNVTRRDFKRKDIESFKRFNMSKFLRSLKTFFAGPTMWLKPVSGLANFTFAYLTTLKESVKNSMGIKGAHAKFSFNDLRYGFSVARELYGKDAMMGRKGDNKAYSLMERFRFMPDNYDWYTQHNQLLTARNTLFSTRTMYAFHTLPEEMIATAVFVAQLKAMKVPDGTSVWDHYVPVKQTDENGVEYITHEWDGTVRGRINTSNVEGMENYEDLTDLRVEEVNAVKYLYEKMHGSYRLDERTYIEYWALGEMIMQFKKYFPAILKNIGASRGERNTQGYFKEEINEKGEKYLKWTPQVIEGRYRLMVGLVLNYLGIKATMLYPNGDKGNALARWLRIQKDDSYDWKSLSEVQKEDIRDFVITTLGFILLTIGLHSMWDWDDEDSLKKLFTRIRDDFAGNVWLPEITRNLVGLFKPIALNKALKAMESSLEVFWSGMLWAAGEDEQAFTQQGNLRGWKELQRNIHLLASWHDLQRFFQETDDLTGPEWLEVRMR